VTGRPARCDVCGDVVDSLHPWDVQTCSCGRLMLSGGAKHRQVHWSAEPGTGWTDLDQGVEDGVGVDLEHEHERERDESDAEPDAEPDTSPPDERSSAGAGPSWLAPRRGDGRLDRAPVDRLPLEEQLDHPIERRTMRSQQPRRPLLGLPQ
jgi:hypothetical protein